MAFLRGGEFLFVEKPAWTKDFYKRQQPLSIPAWGRAKFPLALLLQLGPGLPCNQSMLPSSGLLRKPRREAGLGLGCRQWRALETGTLAPQLASSVDSLHDHQFPSSHPHTLISLSKGSGTLPAASLLS